MSQVPSVRLRVAAASKRIARLKRVDRLASTGIILGGVGIVASVIGILFFILAEAWPLFRPAHAGAPVVVDLAPIEATAAASPLAIGVDEYLRYVYVMRPDGKIALHRMADGGLVRTFPLFDQDDVSCVAASRSPQGDYVASATLDGKIALGKMLFRPVYEDEKLKDLDVDLRHRGLVDLQLGMPTLRSVVYREHEGRKAVAALVGDRTIRLWRTDDDGAESLVTLRGRPGETFTKLALAGVESLAAGTNLGHVFHWQLDDDVRLTDVSPVSNVPITALEWLLGDVTVIAGDQQGHVTGWFRARLNEESDLQPMVQAHTFRTQGSAVTDIAPSTRNKSFAAFGADGSVTYDYLSNERALFTLPGDGRPISAALVAPKDDALVTVRADGALVRRAIDSPHPEITWSALFGKQWYEGYSKPEYVWQSTGMSNAFEPKLSLVPLIFGTIKGTLYALLLAIPLAVFGALYTSQFVHPAVKARIKPTIEIMAALPSVVIGFVAGLWMASLFERYAVAVMLMGVLAPVAGTMGILAWRALPAPLRRRLKPGTEIALIVPLIVGGGWLATRLAPFVEATFFGGDLRLWLASVGLPYDQRNCLVVGVAMGFAVIPIIFTISEDAFSSVPSNLTAASLALGASRWQTALRVVLPTASPGIFSAIMVGFGRAVGETMIVLMATGNTPVLDWSIFNGMRTLSANIAVEIPEAPYGASLYRVLFLSAAVLFAMTFLVNTVAEIIRQRLRVRYRTL